MYPCSSTATTSLHSRAFVESTAGALTGAAAAVEMAAVAGDPSALATSRAFTRAILRATSAGCIRRMCAASRRWFEKTLKSLQYGQTNSLETLALLRCECRQLSVRRLSARASNCSDNTIETALARCAGGWPQEDGAITKLELEAAHVVPSAQGAPREIPAGSARGHFCGLRSGELLSPSSTPSCPRSRFCKMRRSRLCPLPRRW